MAEKQQQQQQRQQRQQGPPTCAKGHAWLQDYVMNAWLIRWLAPAWGILCVCQNMRAHARQSSMNQVEGSRQACPEPNTGCSPHARQLIQALTTQAQCTTWG